MTDTPENVVTKKKLWKYRPFSRVVVGGFRALKMIWDYVQLNEKEALGKISYRKERLRGLSLADWQILWG